MIDPRIRWHVLQLFLLLPLRMVRELKGNNFKATLGVHLFANMDSKALQEGYTKGKKSPRVFYFFSLIDLFIQFLLVFYLNISCLSIVFA